MMYLSGSDSHLTGCGLDVLAMNSLMENNGKCLKHLEKVTKTELLWVGVLTGLDSA